MCDAPLPSTSYLRLHWEPLNWNFPNAIKVVAGHTLVATSEGEPYDVNHTIAEQPHIDLPVGAITVFLPESHHFGNWNCQCGTCEEGHQITVIPKNEDSFVTVHDHVLTVHPWLQAVLDEFRVMKIKSGTELCAAMMGRDGQYFVHPGTLSYLMFEPDHRWVHTWLPTVHQARRLRRQREETAEFRAEQMSLMVSKFQKWFGYSVLAGH